MANKPLISMIVGSSVKIVVSYILIGIPQINIYGAPISTFLSILTIVSMNLFYISRATGYMKSITRLFFKPFVASFISMSCGVGIFAILKATLDSKWDIVLVIAAVFVIYIIFALKMKAVEDEDILMLPLGDKISKLFKKIKLLK